MLLVGVDRHIDRRADRQGRQEQKYGDQGEPAAAARPADGGEGQRCRGEDCRHQQRGGQVVEVLEFDEAGLGVDRGAESAQAGFENQDGGEESREQATEQDRGEGRGRLH